MLYSLGADVNIHDGHGLTTFLLYLCWDQLDYDILKFFIEDTSLDLNQRDIYGQSALFLLAQNPSISLESLKLLLSTDAGALEAIH